MVQFFLNRGRRNSSHNTLQGNRTSDKAVQEKQNDSDEEHGQQCPPEPVGFWDPRLHKTRREVAWKWAVTSKLLL